MKINTIISSINSNKIIEILKHYKFENISGEDMIRCCCKLHEGNNPSAFVINTQNGLWYCHTNCGGGNLFQLIQKLENVDFESSVKILKDLFDINPEQVQYEFKPDYVLETRKWMELMSKHKNIKEYIIPVQTKQVIEYRDFNENILKHFQLQYAPVFPVEKDGKIKYVLRDRLVIPIYFNNKLVGVSLRKTKKNDKIKWFHQPTGINTGALLYNYDDVIHSDEIIITEGIFDVWKYYQAGFNNVVAAFGSHLTCEQVKLLLQTSATKISLSYDNDKAGQEATEKIIDKLRNKFILKLINLPPDKDPCTCTEIELLKHYNERKTI